MESTESIPISLHCMNLPEKQLTQYKTLAFQDIYATKKSYTNKIKQNNQLWSVLPLEVQRKLRAERSHKQNYFIPQPTFCFVIFWRVRQFRMSPSHIFHTKLPCVHVMNDKKMRRITNDQNLRTVHNDLKHLTAKTPILITASFITQVCCHTKKHNIQKDKSIDAHLLSSSHLYAQISWQHMPQL